MTHSIAFIDGDNIHEKNKMTIKMYKKDAKDV
jgi:hypothetical protein